MSKPNYINVKFCGEFVQERILNMKECSMHADAAGNKLKREPRWSAICMSSQSSS